MANSAGSIGVRFYADTGDFTKGIDQTSRNLTNFSGKFAAVNQNSSKAFTALTGSLDSVNTALGSATSATHGMTNGVAKMASTAFDATSGLLGMTSAAVGLGGAFVKLAPLLTNPFTLAAAAVGGLLVTYNSLIDAGAEGSTLSQKVVDQLFGNANGPAKESPVNESLRRRNTEAEKRRREFAKSPEGIDAALEHTARLQLESEKQSVALTAKKNKILQFELDQRIDLVGQAKNERLLAESTALLARTEAARPHSSMFLGPQRSIAEEQAIKHRFIATPGTSEYDAKAAAAIAIGGVAREFQFASQKLRPMVLNFTAQLDDLTSGFSVNLTSLVLSIGVGGLAISDALMRLAQKLSTPEAQAALGGAGKTIAGAAAKTAPITTAAVTAFAQGGGWIGALIAAVAQIIIQAQGFTRVLMVLEKFLSGLIPIVSNILQPFAELIGALLIPLGGLLPVLNGLSEAIAFVILKISDLVSVIIVSVATVADWIISQLQIWVSDFFGADNPFSQNLESLKSGTDLQATLKDAAEFNPQKRLAMDRALYAADAIGEIADPAKDVAGKLKDLSASVDEITHSMVNVPDAFKINQARFDAIVRGLGDTVEGATSVDGTIADAAAAAAAAAVPLGTPVGSRTLGGSGVKLGFTTKDAAARDPALVAFLSIYQKTTDTSAPIMSKIGTGTQATGAAPGVGSASSSQGLAQSSEAGIAPSGPINIAGDLNFNGIENLDDITAAILAKLRLSNFQTTGNPGVPGVMGARRLR